MTCGRTESRERRPAGSGVHGRRVYPSCAWGAPSDSVDESRRPAGPNTERRRGRVASPPQAGGSAGRTRLVASAGRRPWGGGAIHFHCRTRRPRSRRTRPRKAVLTQVRSRSTLGGLPSPSRESAWTTASDWCCILLAHGAERHRAPGTFASAGPCAGSQLEDDAREIDSALSLVLAGASAVRAAARTVAAPDTRGSQAGEERTSRDERTRSASHRTVRALSARAHREHAPERVLALRKVAARHELRALPAPAHAAMPGPRGRRALTMGRCGAAPGAARTELTVRLTEAARVGSRG